VLVFHSRLSMADDGAPVSSSSFSFAVSSEGSSIDGKLEDSCPAILHFFQNLSLFYQ
jgi:hypothetical protein